MDGERGGEVDMADRGEDVEDVEDVVVDVVKDVKVAGFAGFRRWRLPLLPFVIFVMCMGCMCECSFYRDRCDKRVRATMDYARNATRPRLDVGTTHIPDRARHRIVLLVRGWLADTSRSERSARTAAVPYSSWTADNRLESTAVAFLGTLIKTKKKF